MLQRSKGRHFQAVTDKVHYRHSECSDVRRTHGYPQGRRCADGNSATPGKLLLKIEVRDDNLNRLSVRNATKRYFARVISFLTVFGPLILMGDMQNKSLHDKMAGTVVVRRATVEMGKG
ncbi:RDD family protein [Rhizobium sp. MHM7A]|nr:RDD family protein [Rhizobium sp. MHM7A]